MLSAPASSRPFVRAGIVPRPGAARVLVALAPLALLAATRPAPGAAWQLAGAAGALLLWARCVILGGRR